VAYYVDSPRCQSSCVDLGLYKSRDAMVRVQSMGCQGMSCLACFVPEMHCLGCDAWHVIPGMDAWHVMPGMCCLACVA